MYSYLHSQHRFPSHYPLSYPTQYPLSCPTQYPLSYPSHYPLSYPSHYSLSYPPLAYSFRFITAHVQVRQCASNECDCRVWRALPNHRTPCSRANKHRVVKTVPDGWGVFSSVLLLRSVTKQGVDATPSDRLDTGCSVQCSGFNRNVDLEECYWNSRCCWGLQPCHACDPTTCLTDAPTLLPASPDMMPQH
jgi:hypothetical protein